MQEDFWMVCVYGKWYRVDTDVKELIVERIDRMPDGPITKPQLLQTYDIHGSTIYVDVSGVSSIYESTVATRKADDEHTKWLNKEFDDSFE